MELVGLAARGSGRSPTVTWCHRSQEPRAGGEGGGFLQDVGTAGNDFIKNYLKKYPEKSL